MAGARAAEEVIAKSHHPHGLPDKDVETSHWNETATEGKVMNLLLFYLASGRTSICDAACAFFVF